MPDVQNEIGLAGVTEDGDATQVNTDTVGAQRGVSAVRLADGKYVVGWTTEDQNVGGPADNKFRMFDADGSPFGPEMAMPDSGGNAVSAGNIAALDGGGFVAVWSESVEGFQYRYTFHAQRFDSDGVAVGSPVLVGPDTGEPRYIDRIVSTGDGYVILEEQMGFNDAGLFASFVSADGTVLSRQKLGETDANFHRFPRADLLEDGSVLIAYMTAEEHEFLDAVAYQRFAADGTTLAGETFIGNTGSELGYYPDVTALEGGGAIIVWRDRADSLNIKVQKIGADGTETGPRITIESFYGEDYSSQGQVQVEALPDGGFIAAWHASRRSASNADPTIYDIFVAHFDADGAQVGETQVLDGLEEGERHFHDILVKEDGTVLLYWGDPPYAHDVERRGVIQREFSLDLDSGDAALDDADAIEFEPPTLKLLEGAVAQLRFQAVAQDGGELTYSLIQQAASGAAVVNADGSFTYTPNVRFTGQDSFRVLIQDASGNSLEQDIPIAVFDADEIEANWEPFSHSVNGQYFSIEDFAYLGLGNGNLLVATSDYGDGVTTRIFGIDGQAIGDLNVLPPWDLDIEHSAIDEVRLDRTPSGGAVLNWAVESYDGENFLGYFHYVQEVDENGLTDAAPIALRLDHDTSQIEESISGFGFKDSFAVLSDGSYVAAWSDRDADTGMDVALQIFESDGTARTGRVAVTNEDWFEMFPVVVALEDSDFAVTWQKDGARTRIYGSDGLPVTDQITLTDDEGVGSIDVCALGDGGYLAFWKVGNSNDGYQILGRRVASDGTLVGGPITLLDDAEGVTSFDAIRLPEGGFGFRWATYLTHSDTGDEFKVNFMQRFDSNAAEIEEPFLLTVSLSGQYLFTDLTPTADGGFVVGWGPMFRYFEAQSDFGTGVADVLVGNSRSNVMDAGGGDDTVFGGDGADTLLGQAGNDTLDGGDGDDTLIGAAGDDVLIGGAGTDTVRFSGDFDSYSFVSVSGTLTVTDSDIARDGTTTLSGAEVLEFSDRTVVLGDEVQWSATEEAVAENSDPQSVGTVSTNALSSESFELSLADDVDGLFVLDSATGVISTTAPFDYEAQSAYSLTVQAAGDSGSSFTKSFVVSVGDQNEAPVLADGAFSVSENATIGTAFGTLSAADPDGGDSLTYSLMDDAGGLFSIDAASGVISVAGTLDYETAAQHSVVVRATDQGGLSSTATMTVDVEDQGEAPVLADGTFSVAENATIGTAFGTLSATDPDGGDSLTYSLVDDARGLFSIDAASGVLSLVGELDFETADQHQLVVSATDAAGLSDVKTISVDVADVQEPEMLSLFLEQGTQVDSSLRLDDPGNISSIVVLKGEENGVLTLNSDGGFRYVPNADFVGTDSIIVETTDTDGVRSQIELQFEIREKGSIRTTSSDREDVDNPKSGNVYYTKSVALADGKYMVLWTRTENGGTFRGQVYDSNDEPVGEQSVLADFTPRSEESGIARFSVNPDSSGGAILSWVTRTDFGWRIYAQRVGSDGQAISEPLILDEVHSGNWMLDLAGVVETSDGEFSAFWGNFVGSKPGPSNWRQVVSRKISADFELVGDRTVVADGIGNSDNLVGQLVALDEGRVAVVWTEIDRESEYLLNNQVLIQFLDREGVPEPNGPFVLDGPNIGHPVHLEKLADGSIAALWTQKMGDPRRPENPIRSNVVLSHISDRGELISGPNLVRELTGGDLKIHSTSLMLMPDGNLAVNWVEGEWNQPENFREFIQRFDPDGTPVGALIDLDALTGGETVFADYSVLSDGRILAASSQFDSERTYYDYAKRRILSLAANLGTSHDDHIFLGDLGDDVGASTGNDIVVGGAGNDTIFGGSGADTLFGGDGDDFIVGGSGNDTLTGGGGNDFIVSDAGEDVLDGGDGDDTFVLNVDDVTSVQAIGGAGHDTVRLVGLDGASAIHAESGTISIDGTIAVHGEGLDKVEFVFDGMDALNTASPTVHDAGSAVQFDGADPGYFETIIGGLSGKELSVTANADLIVDLSDGYSREALTAVKEALGAVVTYGADSTLQFWNVMNNAVDIDAVLAEFSFAHHVDLNAELTFEIDAPEVVHTEAVAAELSAQAEGNFSADAVTPNDPSYGSLYGLRYISAPDAWEIRSDASSVVIGVIDTGIDVDHPDLVNNLWVNEGEIWGDGIDNDGNGYIDDYNGYDFFNDRGIGPGSNSDGHGHGTHVAGTIAAEGNNGIGVSGVAWNASLMAVKIFSDAGTTNTAAIIAGIQYATMMGAQVTNNSWGGGAYNASLVSAIQAAQAAGSIFVAAAGNDSLDNDIVPHYPATYNLDNIVAVASTDSFDRLSSFSNYGATTVDLGAPGTGIYSTYKNSTYATLNGTSMATPHVTGAIALMRAENPSLSYSEIIDALLNSVDSISSMNGITASGGRLNLEAALLAVQDGEGPIVTAHNIFLAEGVGSFRHAINIINPTGVSVSVQTAPAIGSLSLVEDEPGTFDYTPGAGNYGERVDLRVTNAEGSSSVATFFINQMAAGSTTITGADSADLIIGGSADELLSGGGGNDIIRGGDGNDTLIGDAGADTLDGGAGVDTADYSSFATGVTVALDGSPSSTGDTIVNVENLIGSNQADKLTGNDDANVLVGGQGNDTLVGGAGADTLIGLDGTDYASYETTAEGLTISMPHGIGTGDAEGDLYLNMEGIIGGQGNDRILNWSGTISLFGEDGDDILIGSSGHQFDTLSPTDFLSGDDGNDTLIGLDGDDTIYGGDGDDLIFAGRGTNTVFGGAGSDTLHLGYLAGSVDIDMANGIATGAEFGTVTFTGIESIVYVDAGSGTVAATEDTEIFVDTYATVIDYSASGEAITIDLRTASGSGGLAEGDILVGDISLRGTDFDDTIHLSQGDQTIDGGAGSDTVHFSAAFDSYSISDAGGSLTVEDQVSGRDGANVLRNVERLVFTDRVVTLGGTPEISIDAGTIDENTPEAQSAATVSVTAMGLETYTFSLVDDHGGLFSIGTADGVVQSSGAVNYEAQAAYTLTVQAIGDQGTTLTQDFVVAVDDLNDLPVLSGPETYSVVENTAVGAIVGTQSPSDEDAGDAVTLSLLDDAGGLFSIDAQTGVISVAGGIDYETASQHTLIVQASDSSGGSVQKTLTVDVANVDDTPPSLNAKSGFLLQGGSLDGYVAVSDDGESLTHTFSLTRGPDHGAVTVNADGTYRYDADGDYAGGDSFDITVLASDGQQATTTVTMTVSDGSTTARDDFNASTDIFYDDDPPGYHLVNMAVAKLQDGGYINYFYRYSSAWTGYISGRRFDSDGNAVGGMFDVTGQETNRLSYLDVIETTGGGHTLRWNEYLSGSQSLEHLQEFNAEGVAVGTPIVNEIVSAPATTFFVGDGQYTTVARDGYTFILRTVNADGVIGDTAVIPTDVDSTQSPGFKSAAQLSDGNLVLVWSQAPSDSPYDRFYVRRVDPHGQVLGETVEVGRHTSLVNGRLDATVTALANGNYVVTWVQEDASWWGVFGRVYDATDTAVTDAFQIHQHDAVAQDSQYVKALPDGRFIVAWKGLNSAMWVRIFDTDGSPLGDDIQLGPGTSGDIDIVSLDNGDVAISWLGASDIYRRHFNVLTQVSGSLLTGDDGDNVLSMNDVGGTLIGAAGNDELYGGDGDDTLNGGAGADMLDAGAGDDILVADLSDTAVRGGEGSDTAAIAVSGGTVAVSVSDGTIASDAGSLAIDGVERVVIGSIASFTSVSDPGPDAAGGDSVDTVNTADAVDLIVDLSRGYSRAALLQAREDLGAKVLYGDGGAIQFWDIEGDAAAGLDLFAELETAGFAELDGQLSVDFQFESDILSSDQLSEELSGQEFETSATAPNDPSIGSLYGLNKIGAYDAWDRQTGSEDVVVAVIDSGIDIDHEDLRDNLWVNEGEIWGDGIDNDGNGYIDDYNGYDFVNNRGIGPGYARDDDNGHGTHVAGTIAAQGNNGVGISGVAWNASLMAVKVLDQNGDGTIADIVEGIRYATMMEARVSNNSYGGYGYRGSYSSISSAISEARTAGSIFVAAAGNDSFDNDTYNNYNYSYFSHYPSSFTQSNVVAVASTTSSDSLSSFSNYGRYSVDLGAPGSSIYSTYTGGGYRSLSGTSMATPHVTGAIALLLSEDPSMTYSQAIDAILDNVDRVSSLNGRSTSGGRLNVAAALGTVSGDDTPPILSVRDLMMSDDITTLGLGFTATDNSGDPVTISVSGLDYGGISFNVYSQSFLYSAAAGAYVDNFTVTARDAAGNATSQNMRVTRVTDTDGVTLTGTASDEAMFGGSNSDTLTGGAGDDYLAGGSGDDYLMGGAGDDTIYGGDGIDTVSFADATAGVQASLAGNSGGGDAFYQVEILEGSAFNDTLAGSSGDDVLIGGAGDDELSGGAGADTLIGGEGLDLADYSSDSAGITVSLLDGTKTGAAAGDTYSGIEGVIGGSGADLLIGDDAANQFFGEDGNDTILGGDGADTLFGMDGDDTIVGGRGADSLYGGDGADLIFAGDGDSVNGGAGVDTLDLGYLSGGVSVDFDNGVVSGAEIGTITFQNIENVAYSVAQNGTITATAAADFLVQTNGNLVDYSGSDAAITLDMGLGSASGGHAEGDVFQDVTHVRGSNFDDRFAGSDRDDTIHGGAGTDTLTLAGDFSEYSLTVDNGLIVIDDLVAGRDGTDRVSGVESLEFADRTVGVGNGILLLPAHGAADENAGAGLTVGQVTMFALGAETFALTLQDDFGGLFAIDAVTGEITTRSDLDFESAASYELTVLASGDQGSSETTTVTVSVNDVNEAPEDLALTSFSVAEDAAVGAALATLSVNDPDANDSHSFVLLDDADGLFSIDAETGVIRVAAGLDFETAPAHVLTVRGTDTGGLSNEWQVSISVTDANDAPDAPTVSLVPSIGEHATIGAVVGTASTTDQDVGDSVSYSLVDDHGGAFAIDADSGVITVAGGLDYETDAAPVLQIRASDSGGLSSVGSSTLTVTDENDAPISGADQFSGFEETAVSIAVADLLANDSDQDGDDLSLVNVENPTGGTVSLNDGQIVFSPDEEFTGLATFDYVLQDSHGATSTITVDIDISAQAIVAEGGAGSDDMRGGSAHDTLSGGDGSDILMGRKGDDVLIGGAGDDTYVYRIGDGADILDETGVPGGGGSDTLRFGTGISASQMEAHIEGRDLVLRFIDDGDLQLSASGDVLRLRNWLDSDARIEGFTFDDQPGVTLSASDMLSRFGGTGDEDFTWTEAAVSLFGRGGADRLVTGDNDDTLSGGTGNDVLIAGGGNDKLDGGGASNLISWSEHYGRDVYYKDDVLIADGEVDSPVEGAQVTRLVPGTGPGMHRLIRAVQVVEAGIHTVSVYAMADELDGLRLEMASGWDGASFAHYGTAAFDIEGGSVSGTNRDVLGAEVEDIGGGWYRVSAQMEFVTGTSYVNLNVRNAGADVFSRESEGGGLYLSGLQLERGETAGEYVATRAVATVEPDGDDHLEGGGGNDSLSGGAGNDVLIGGSAENQMTWSGDFGHRAYLKDGAVVTEAGIDGPLSGIEGYRLSATDVDGFHRIIREVRVDEPGIHTASLYVRTDELDHLQFELASGWDGASFAHYGSVVFNLSEGRAESRSSTIHGAKVENLGNGWSRVSAQMSFEPGSSYFNVYLHDGNFYGFSNGDGRGLYIAGAQLESGNSVGAYLETTDTAVLGGEDGSDYLVGGDGDDRVFGGAGADTIVGGSGRGNDVYSGGSGQDTIIYSSAEARIDVDLDEGYGRGADIDFDTLSGIENVVGGAGDDRLSGTDDANIIEGAGGDDLIVGGAGNDILIGDGTQNQITWSEDFTNAVYNKDGIGLETASGDALGFGMSATRLIGTVGNAMHRMNRTVTIATSGLYTVSAYVRADQLSHLRFELASGLNNGVFDHYGSVVFDATTGQVHGSHGALHSASVTDVGDGWYRVEATMPFTAGTSYVNTYLHDGTSHVFAGDGTSGLYFTGLQLEAGAAASSYHMTQESRNAVDGAGDDRILAGAGDDAIFGGAGIDTLDYRDDAAGVTVDLVSGTATGSAAGSDRFSGIENVVGGAGDDVITGTAAINRLIGGDGADRIVAGTEGEAASAARRENLMTWSAAFSGNNYLKDGTRVVAIMSDSPVSGASVSRLTANAGTGFHRMNRNISVAESGTYTTSIYAKAETLAGLRFEMASGWNGSGFDHYGTADFDLAGGRVLGSAHDIANATIESVGGGWYRVTATMSHAAGTSHLNVYMMNQGTHFFAGNGAESLLISGAQFESGTVARTYVETTTATVRQAAVGDVLIGDGQENLANWSDAFDNAAYYKDGVSVVTNVADGPEAGMYADRVLENDATANHRIMRAVTVMEAGIYVASVYARAEDVDHLRFELASGWDGGSFAHYGTAVYDLSQGSVDGTTHALLGADIEDVGDGWYRVSARMEMAVGQSYVNMYLHDGASHFYDGDATGSVLLSGMQVERGGIASDYTGTTQSGVYHAGSDDVLVAGAGDDILSGGTGNDRYEIARDGGDNTIHDAGGTADSLVFGDTVNHDQLWFERSGDDLRVSIIGNSGSATISDWFASDAAQVESIVAGDGMELSSANVLQLVQAMAAQTRPGDSDLTLPQETEDNLQSVLAASWSSAG